MKGLPYGSEQEPPSPGFRSSVWVGQASSDVVEDTGMSSEVDVASVKTGDPLGFTGMDGSSVGVEATNSELDDSYAGAVVIMDEVIV